MHTFLNNFSFSSLKYYALLCDKRMLLLTYAGCITCAQKLQNEQSQILPSTISLAHVQMLIADCDYQSPH